MSQLLRCGKCNTNQEMTKYLWGSGEQEYSWICPNCNDIISKSAVGRAR